MYVTTFYSFKGGVGRTMALVNAAVDLAGRGRRVLVVDFDLEAPGLDTFDLLRPRTPTPGIIDFVGEYLASGRAPDVERFIGEASGVVGDGRLWVMPSGLQDTYAANFNQIDWGALYGQHDGYLLFEDLKEQWRRTVEPDYVLIDSRTGHTDTGGICTRQLPDAVAILFFPNEQNLRGLTKVVADIRSEAEAPRNKTIDLHFVMSNVPDLDDEDSILEEQIEAFRHQLSFDREPMVVHRYDSLSLLNQVVFTKDRPKSRLAREYREFVREIARRNSVDRDGALDYIEEARERWRGGARYESSLKADKVLQEIEEAHSRDGEVLFRLGTLRENEGQTEWAASLYDRAIEAGCDFPQAYYRRARVNAADDPEGASEDAVRVLQSEGVPPPMVRHAIRLAARAGTGDVDKLRAVSSLDAVDRLWLANALMESPHDDRIAASILLTIVGDEQASEKERTDARGELSLAYIGTGNFAGAEELLRRETGEMDIQDAFNYGMAIWGATGAVNAEAFARVVALDREDPEEKEQPNYLQCMAVAYWAIGETDTAAMYADRARAAVHAVRGPELSCWRYYRVGEAAFLEDLDEIEALIGGDASRKPRFMADAVH